MKIKRAAIVGAGTMGRGIAIAYASAGLPVLLKDIGQSHLDSAIADIRESCQASVARGKMTEPVMRDIATLITPTSSFRDFDTVDIVTEAVFESMALKKSVFVELSRVTRPDCILASNTSTLSIDEIAKSSGRPEQVVGHHYFCPAHIMKLIEIVRGSLTSQKSIELSRHLATRLGKVSVVVGDCFGFVANRMLMHYMREAYLLLEEGGSVQQVDNAIVKFGFPLGPFALQDLVGLDVGARIRRDLRLAGRTLTDGPQSALPDLLFGMGRYGRKTNAGWYNYNDGKRSESSDPVVDEIVDRIARDRGVVRSRVDDEEIVGRTMSALVNEGAKILEASLTSQASEIDLIFQHGFGFPRHHGGPMRYADNIGLATILARIRKYRAEHGEHWAPSSLLQRLAASGGRFHS